DRLRSRKLHGQICNTQYNTGLDALSLIIQKHDLMTKPSDAGTYSVLTLHRLETLSRGKKLRQAIQYAIRLADSIGPIRFFLHGPTQRALERHDLLKNLQDNPAFTLAPLLPYPEFMRQVLHCRYLLTDGGSIQEEASYMQKPCLILRNRTERRHGLDSNSRLAAFDEHRDLEFLRMAENKQPDFRLNLELSASRKILSFIK
ncbi:MAG: UDP-N-acetylglucosamine 2-epimerase, partial [Ktedonobacteraceae bacterium]